MSERSSEEIRRFVIRVPASLHAAVTEAAAERHHSANWLIVKALEDFLPRLIPASEIKLTRAGSEVTDGE